MNKKTVIIIISIVLLLALATGGYIYWSNLRESKAKSALENAGDAAEKIKDSATKGVLPSLGTNPLENKPDINPADKANPFKDIKINPF